MGAGTQACWLLAILTAVIVGLCAARRAARTLPSPLGTPTPPSSKPPPLLNGLGALRQWDTMRNVLHWKAEMGRLDALIGQIQPAAGSASPSVPAG